ncbi:MAG TPA: DinB family protein [Candidatus Methylomirabilis sp.]|nr:DinB family protein [Candidatus Methylomirabilis sp.]
MTPKQFIEYAESIYRPTAKLISLAPANKLDWKPAKGNYMSLGQLLHHLATCPGVFVAVVNNAFPPAEAFQKFVEEDLKNTKTPEVAAREASRGWDESKAALQSVSDGDFQSKMVSVPWGPPMPLWRVSLGMADHWVNHKYQLFFYLKLLGLPVNSMTLYAGA